MREALGLSALLLCSALNSASAQTLRGVVLDDSTRSPVQGAVVAVLDSKGKQMAKPAPVRTDSAGRFALFSASAGDFSLRVTRIGYVPLVSSPQAVGASETLTLTLSISVVPARLGTVIVSERRRFTNLDLMSDLGFELRRSLSYGRFMDTSELNIYRRSSMQDVLVTRAGMGVMYVSGRGLVMRRPGSDRFGQPLVCTPEIWIDGFTGRPVPVEFLGADQIFGVEVFTQNELPPISVAGEMGSDQSGKPRRVQCGIIAIWTKQFVEEMRKKRG